MNKKNLFILLSLLLTFTLACSLFNPELFGDDQPNPSGETPAEMPTESVADEIPPVNEENGACNNILYPLVVGQEMIYQSTGADGSTKTGITVADLEGNIATVNMLDMSTGITTQSTVECEDGAIKNFPAITMGTVLGDSLNGNLSIDYQSGYIAPSEETLVANNWDMSWESSYVMNGEFSMEEEGESVTIKIDNSPVLMKWQTAGRDETITVGAGTYTNTIKLTREMTMDIALDMDGMNIDSTLLIKSTHWFAPYVGLIKMEVSEVTLTMQGMSFPVPMGETMELIEFHPAK